MRHRLVQHYHPPRREPHIPRLYGEKHVPLEVELVLPIPRVLRTISVPSTGIGALSSARPYTQPATNSQVVEARLCNPTSLSPIG